MPPTGQGGLKTFTLESDFQNDAQRLTGLIFWVTPVCFSRKLTVTHGDQKKFY